MFWNKLAKNVRICVFKKFDEQFMSKSKFFYSINAQKHADHI